MKTKLILISWLFFSVFTNAQNIYLKTFGKKTDKPILFLHGGPGYNAANFESTTADKLAKNGFFVIVYDRRGEGRSNDKNATYTFDETFQDINNILNKFELKNVTLLGHSFGGIIATLYAKSNSEKVKNIILVGAPISLQETFQNIIKKSKDIYKAKNDSINLKYISLLEKMDTKSIEYSSYSFAHAMQNGFYTPKNPSVEAQKIYATFKTDTLLIKNASKMNYEAPLGFWQNEKYTNLDLTETINEIIQKKIKIFGLYGNEDGLYSKEQIIKLEKQIGLTNLKYLDNCSHNVFIDQQTEFISSVNKWIH